MQKPLVDYGALRERAIAGSFIHDLISFMPLEIDKKTVG
jgi:hypothetical protein